MWDDRKFNAAHYNFHGNTQDPIFITKSIKMHKTDSITIHKTQNCKTTRKTKIV